MTTLMTIWRVALGGLLALALAPAFWPGEAAAHTCDDPLSTDLIAGQKIDAGNVEVCNDDTTLTITYEATFPWCLLKTDLHVATSRSGIPRNRPGNPIPGRFDYGDEHDCAGTAAFEISLDEIDGGVIPGDTVAIAAHADVEDGAREEGAWGKGTRFVERGNWAMYFTYEVQEAVVPCPEVCVAGLNEFAQWIERLNFGRGDPLQFHACGFDTSRDAGTVRAIYWSEGPISVADIGHTNEGSCHGVVEGSIIMDVALSPAEQASCAPLAVDILPEMDETDCDISPP
jgi:hypothetical protein